MQYSLVFSSLVLINSLATASPLLTSRQAALDCTDPSFKFNRSCWAALEIPKYLSSWIKTTPTCGANGNGQDCCTQDEAWSTCFLRLAYGVAGSDCTKINTNSCTWDPELAPSLGQNVRSRARYVVRNIYSINNMITSLYRAFATSAETLAGFPKDVQAGLGLSELPASPFGDMSTALSAAPFVLANKSLTAPLADSTLIDQATAEAFLTSIKQAPTVAKTYIPAPVQGDANAVENTGRALLPNLSASLKLIMTDSTQFLAFADGGAYNDNSIPEFTQNGEGLNVSPHMYIISSLLQANSWYAVPGASVASREAFRATCDADTYDEQAGFCTQNKQTVYWSSDTARTYAFSNKKSSNAADVLKAVVANELFGLNFMFDGNYNCTAAGKAGGSVLQFAPDGTPDVSCLSRLPIYLSCNPMAECPTEVRVGGKCPFGYDGSCV